VVPVADTTRREYSEFEREQRHLGDVLDQWERSGFGKEKSVGGQHERTGAGLYVKDWHLLHELESAGGSASEVYDVPECLRGECGP
jgi:hypothetical protein